jgi:hypothetical protein
MNCKVSQEVCGNYIHPNRARFILHIRRHQLAQEYVARDHHKLLFDADGLNGRDTYLTRTMRPTFETASVVKL